MADGVEYLQQMPAVDCIFLDPARRNEHGGKTVAISDCEPNVATLEKLLLEKGKQVMIKLSPMLDSFLGYTRYAARIRSPYRLSQQRVQGASVTTPAR